MQHYRTHISVKSRRNRYYYHYFRQQEYDYYYGLSPSSSHMQYTPPISVSTPPSITQLPPISLPPTQQKHHLFDTDYINTKPKMGTDYVSTSTSKYFNNLDWNWIRTMESTCWMKKKKWKKKKLKL